ncbi:methylmalonyl-CoA mutase [Leptospira kobayashii]|uniref:Methylmalonyl-CoA mutase n=1 Tax=Leptospira kobayashii TaxID=1917830 RepID=A0ABM7UNU3_9LEPT|nr:methylmalonyl-CoA mutase family protein [Leptospira kobayashii]BDA80823.1 methylmalonyl-CoA mutase [Leptospira kobayashii]
MEDLLFSEFPGTGSQTWKDLILKDLKGASYDKVQWETEEGFSIEPYYRAEDLEALDLPTLQRKEKGWLITDPIYQNQSITLANEEAKSLEKKGADALLFYSHEEAGNRFGIPLPGPDDLQRLFSGLDLKKTPVILSLANRTPDFAKEIRSFAKEAKQILTDYDPLGSALLCGEMGGSEEKIKSNLATLVSSGSERFICIHSYYLRESGSTITQELAYSLAWAVEYLNILIESGAKPSVAAGSVWFWTGIGSDYFTEIAKFRSLRVLWAKILDAFEPGLGEKSPAQIHASTTEWNFTAYDPYVNMLRGTTAAMSAVIGGADSVTVHPFDKVYNDSNEFGVRIARNSQLLLRHESHLDKVDDPSSGSYYLESLTHKLCEVSWTEFQSVEKDGGFYKSLLDGKIQSKIESSEKKKREAVSSRKQTLLGTNQYPLASERHSDLQDSIGKSNDRINAPVQTKFKRLNYLRLSWDFDRLRFATDVHFEKTKSVPKVFLLTIGNLGMRKARAAFSSNYIGCLGYTIQDNLGFDSIEEGIQAAKNFKADMVVLCSSDEEYIELIPAFCEGMKKNLPNVWRVLAGFPKDLISKSESEGIEDFIHLKRNVIEFMEKAQKKLGVL